MQRRSNPAGVGLGALYETMETANGEALEMLTAQFVNGVLVWGYLSTRPVISWSKQSFSPVGQTVSYY